MKTDFAALPQITPGFGKSLVNRFTFSEQMLIQQSTRAFPSCGAHYKSELAQQKLVLLLTIFVKGTCRGRAFCVEHIFKILPSTLECVNSAMALDEISVGVKFEWECKRTGPHDKEIK